MKLHRQIVSTFWNQIEPFIAKCPHRTVRRASGAVEHLPVHRTGFTATRF